MPMKRELIVDNFAGGGGASEGMELAGLDVHHAINHSAEALALHAANHPWTKHHVTDVWEVDPEKLCAGEPVGLAWFSPDCRHFSRAKGAALARSEKVRGLAWVVIRWARTVRPRVILLENVEEFLTWGPLDDEGRPIPEHAGRTFRRWLSALQHEGYTVEWRLLVAADYGAPTTRKRLFLVARCDGEPIVWPEPTHGPGRSRPWRTAAEIIDWSLPCPSIFGRKKPLADATLRRIAAGVMRYVVNSTRPFVVKGGAATLIQAGYGEREGQRPRALDIGKPLGTVVAGGLKHALVTAFLTKHYGGVVGHELTRPLGAVTAQDHHSLTTATLAPASPDRREEVRAFLVKYYGAGESQTQPVTEPLHTVTTKARFGLVQVEGQDYEIADIGMRMLSPAELFLAQGFPADYRITAEHNGRRLTKTQQIRLAGNSVCPPVAAAIVRANAPRGLRVEAA